MGNAYELARLYMNRIYKQAVTYIIMVSASGDGFDYRTKVDEYESDVGRTWK